jgi:hypothetical protein
MSPNFFYTLPNTQQAIWLEADTNPSCHGWPDNILLDAASENAHTLVYQNKLKGGLTPLNGNAISREIRLFQIVHENYTFDYIVTVASVLILECGGRFLKNIE